MHCDKVIEVLDIYCKKMWYSDIIKVGILKTSRFKH
jgi:hypothetical protein